MLGIDFEVESLDDEITNQDDVSKAVINSQSFRCSSLINTYRMEENKDFDRAIKTYETLRTLNKK